MVDFFDGFFVVVIISVSLLCFIDWWIGPEGRSALRESMGTWWIYLDDTSYSELTFQDIFQIKNWFSKLFGHKFFSVLFSSAHLFLVP